MFERNHMSESIINLPQEKMKLLDKCSQEAIKIFSALGSSFSLSFLALIVDYKEGVENALAAGFITQCEGSGTCC